MIHETTYKRQDTSKEKFGGLFLAGALLGGLAGLVIGHECYYQTKSNSEYKLR